MMISKRQFIKHCISFSAAYSQLRSTAFYLFPLLNSFPVPEFYPVLNLKNFFETSRIPSKRMFSLSQPQPPIRFEKAAFEAYRQSASPSWNATADTPHFILNPSSTMELLRSIAYLRVTVDVRSLYLTSPPPSLEHLDRRTIPLLESANVRDALKIMTAWFDKIDHHIQTLVCFKKFLTVSEGFLSECDFDDLVGVVFFWGMAKRAKAGGSNEFCRMVESRLEKFVDSSANISYEATVLLCANLHKMNHVIKSERVLAHIVRVVQDAIDGISDYGSGRFFGIIACLKLLRHSRLTSDSLNQSVAAVITKFGFELNATELYHFTAVLANSNYTCKDALEVSETRLKQFLEVPKEALDHKAHPSEFLRLKDVQGVTWACASLGYSFSGETASLAKKFFWRTFQLDAHLKDPSVYVDTLYALIVMGHHFPELAAKVMTRGYAQMLRDSGKGRMLAKMCIVENAMNIELGVNSSVVSSAVSKDDMPYRSVYKDMNQRKPLLVAYNALKECQKVEGGFQCSPVYQIPRISYSGLKINLLGSSRRSFNVEVLDGSVITRPDLEPVGLMKLKLRLMRAQKVAFVTLSEQEVTDNAEKLFSYIMRKLSSSPKISSRCAGRK